MTQPRTHGSLLHHGNTWEIECEPYCMIRLKRIFERVTKQFGKVVLRDTEETCRELVWFMQRFPLTVSNEDVMRLHARAYAFDRKTLEFSNILGGKIAPRPFKLALPLREYQAVAAELALRCGGLLIADEVGVGKSSMAIGMLVEAETRPALVVTMTHLTLQWQREIAKFAPDLRTHIIEKGTPYEVRVRKFRGGGHAIGPFPDVLIMNYHKLAGWAESLAGKIQTVVFDEISELRHPGAGKYRAAKHIADKARWKCGLSATPIANYGNEFYHVLDVLRPDALGTYDEFMREWCKDHATRMGQDNASLANPRVFGAYLREQALMIRRTRKDVGRELPDVQIIPHTVDSDPKALDATKTTATALARILLGQTSAWAERGQAARELDSQLRRATGIAKSVYVADFVRMLCESGEKVVLYGWHRDVYAVWLERLADLHPVMFTGSETSQQKEASRKAFVEGNAQILIMSLRAGAGLDGLQDHTHLVVFGELDWSPGVHHQAIGRVHRDGQANPVVVYYLLADEGSDPVIADVLGVKRAQLEGVIDPDAQHIDIAKLQIDPNHIKKLARAYLDRVGAYVPEEPPLPPGVVDLDAARKAKSGEAAP